MRLPFLEADRITNGAEEADEREEKRKDPKLNPKDESLFTLPVLSPPQIFSPCSTTSVCTPLHHMPPWLLPSSSSLPPTTSSNSFPSLTSTSSSSASSSNSRATTPQPRASQRSRARKTIFSGGSGGAPDVVSREGHRLPTRDRLNSTSPSSPSNSQTTTPSLSSTRETNRTSKGKKTTGALYRSTSCCICTSSIEFERLERAQCVRCERCGVWNDYLPPLSTILRTREVDDSVDARCRICHGEGAGDSEEQERDCKCLEHDKDGRYDEAGKFSPFVQHHYPP